MDRCGQVRQDGKQGADPTQPTTELALRVPQLQDVANALGTTEIIAAILIAIHPLWPRISALGSTLAIALFLGTISFLFTTPGVIADFVHGFPVLSAQPGEFLLKDLVLIGVALWTLGDSIEAGWPRLASNTSSHV
ncbi:DUF417 family protein [Planotetraspora kaengkrachanensis]|uniref:DUF417 family protein n=1 Tax=Planotetraspora kaengkrachanensis TaxID=575193 RepID=A0A8J3VBT7_9ACTN|nr:DUF417 family protein [Planotetraspora kaengkrachanensis]GIG84282.1 hypothetical protein Pka01_74090 [Planotetraspora kaengkrachanensis]